MRRTTKLLMALILWAILLVPMMPSQVNAAVNDFVITTFDSDIQLSRGDPQGQARITEKITVKFNDYNKGILRAIPLSYKGHPLQLRVGQITLNDKAVEHTTYEQNGNEVLKIGDPNKTVTGLQVYKISYTVDNVITFYEDHDEFYWDINGDQTQQIIQQVNTSVYLPKGLKIKYSPICYTGGYESRAQNCTAQIAGTTINAKTTEFLTSYQTLTVIAGFEKGYFSAPTLKDNIQDKMADAIKFLLPLAVIGGFGFVWWLKHGRDAKGSGTIIPQYEPPQDLKPLSVGTLIDFQLDSKDLTATLIDLAVRKYIKIIEIDTKKALVFKGKDYNLQLINPDFSKLDVYETQLLGELFPGAQKDAMVGLKDKAHKLYTAKDSIQKAVRQNLTTTGYFKKNPKDYSAKAWTFIVFVFVGVTFVGSVLGFWLSAGIIAGVVIAGLFYAQMGARTALGSQAKDQILGLKMYMEIAEKDRINKMQSPNAPYAAPGGPVKTVELFEKLLPYAIALGVEKQWSDKFANLYTAPPDWYQGNFTSFNAGYLAGSLSGGMNSAVSSAFTAPSSSGSSGFSGGGGFAGGGGGGGGVGGW